jgi:hypothetical protein
MTDQKTQILDLGGLLLRMVWMLVLRVLCALCGGLIVGTFVVLVLFLIIVDREYRRSLFVSELDKQKLLGGSG